MNQKTVDFKSTHNKPTGLEPVVVSVNGVICKLNGYLGVTSLGESDKANRILFPQATRNNVVSIITDSTQAPEMKQGDFAVLKDFGRELVSNGTFDTGIDGWIQVGTATISNENSTLKVIIDENGTTHGCHQGILVVPGVEYKVTVDLKAGTSSATVFFSNSPQWVNDYHSNVMHQEGNSFSTFETIIKPTKNILYINLQASDNVANGTAYFDNISIKQVSEQPIVALQDVPVGTDIYQNTDKFEARDSVSSQDLVFLETWHEDVSEKDIVYPYGNIQYRGGDVDGLSGIADGAFAGADTYSLFGNWQDAGSLVGKGYVWSQLSEDDKIKFAGNPDNNVYKYGDKWIQVRYRIRVVKGLGSEWKNINKFNKFVGGSAVYSIWPYYVRFKTKNTTINYDLGPDNGHILYTGTNINPSYQIGVYGRHGEMAMPIAIVQRRNSGIYHPVYNPEGCATVYDAGSKEWWETSIIGSLSDCFDLSKIAAKDSDGNIVAANDANAVNISGTIVCKISGRPDGLYADEINERDVEDLRMSAHKKPYKQILDEWNNKAIAGEVRGKEKQLFLKAGTSANDINSRWHDGINLASYLDYTTYTYNNTLTHTDILGDPRKIQDRVTITTVTGDNQTATVNKNTYVKADDHYYRSLVDRGSITVDPDTEDYTNTSNWINLGTDGTVGGYPDEWLQHGIAGTPLIVGEEGESLLPVDIPMYHNWLSLKISKKGIGLYSLLVKNKNGEFVKYKSDNADPGTIQYGYYYNSCNRSNNGVYIDISNSYSGLGYASKQEMLDEMVVLVTYKTKANFLELAGQNVPALHIGNVVHLRGAPSIFYGGVLNNFILNKVGTNATTGYAATRMGEIYNFYLRENNYGEIGSYDMQIPTHKPLNFNANVEPQSKVLPYLTQQNNRAYLQYVFKELKYDTSTSSWGDDNKFQIVDKVSAVTDLNGKTVLIGQKRCALPYFIAEE